MAEQFSGFSSEQVRNAAFIKDSMTEINNLTRSYNKALGSSAEVIADVTKEYAAIKASADRVAEVQREAASSASATRKAIAEQNKQLNIVARLNARIDRLYEQAAKATGNTRDNLMSQARNLTAARDNAKSLSDSFSEIASDSTKLTKSNYVFSTLADLVKGLPGGDVLATPFEAAAEASRKTTLENSKTAELRDKLAQLTDTELTSGKGLTKERIKQLGLEADLGNKTGKSAAKQLRNLQTQSKTSSSMMAGLNAGAKALGPALSKAFAPLAIVNAVVSAFKLIFDLMKGTQEQSVGLARNLGLTEASANATREEYFNRAKAMKASGLQFASLKSLLSAQEELNKELGISVTMSAGLQETTLDLEHTFRLTSAQAAKTAVLLNTMPGGPKQALADITEMVNQMRDAGQTGMDAQDVFKGLAEVSAETAGYYGGNVKALARAQMQARRLGMTLDEARNAGKGMVDFQESMSAEMQLEQLLQKDLNLDRLRQLKIEGKHAQAAAEALRIYTQIPKHLRHHQAISSMIEQAGIGNVEALDAQLLKASQYNKALDDRNRRLQEYKEFEKSIYETVGMTNEEREKELQAKREALGLDNASIEALRKQTTVTEQFQLTMSMFKEQLADLVTGSPSVLQSLTNILQQFVSHMSAGGSLLGFAFGSRQGGTPEEIAARNADLTKQANEKLAFEMAQVNAGTMELSQALARTVNTTSRKGTLTQDFADQLVTEYGDAARTALNQAKQSGDSNVKRGASEISVNDFQIKTNPKDTLVMAGGTKFGSETNALLERLISAVEKGGHVYLDGNRVGTTLMQSQTKFS